MEIEIDSVKAKTRTPSFEELSKKEMTILHLLMGASEPGSYRTLTWVPGFADVWFAVNER